MGSKQGKEMLLIGSKTKEALKSTGLNVSSEALEKLNEKVYLMIADAQQRCINNNRKTVKATDF
jgi:histone H3/H4